jgi:phospholipid-binding lipoprotein MlaA
MSKIVSPRIGVAMAAALGLSACVTLPPNHVKNPQDPWESWNRGVYRVNDKVDRAVVLPVAKAYVRHVPGGIRASVSNFFANVTTPGVMVNDALEGKFKNAGADLGRFLMNTLVGFGGLFDPASSAGLPRNYADFGLTLGHWGVHPGPFFELPVLGPSTVRDGLGKVPDYYLRPTTYIPSDWVVGYVLWLPAAIDARAALLPLQPTLDQAFDPYAVIRDAYLSRRAYLVSDGKISPSTELVDPDADQSPAPGGPAIATPPSEASPSPGAAPSPGSAPQPATPPEPPPEPAPSPQPPPP